MDRPRAGTGIGPGARRHRAPCWVISWATVPGHETYAALAEEWARHVWRSWAHEHPRIRTLYALVTTATR